MLTAVKGIYRGGQIILTQRPDAVRDETPVLVTFLEPPALNLSDYGIDLSQAAELRERLATFTADWDSPEMEVYDDYDARKAELYCL